MNFRQLFTPIQPAPLVPPSVTAEEERQLDLLLGEINAHERQFSANYWATKAQLFADKMAFQEAANKTRRASRFSQLKPYLTSLLPLGGLVALGLTFSGAPRESHSVENSALSADVTVTANTPLVVLHSDGVKASVQDVAAAEQAPLLEAERAPSRSHMAPIEKPRVSAARLSAPKRATGNTVQSTLLTTSAAAQAAPFVAPTVEPETVPRVSAAAPESLREVDTFAQQLQALKRADKALKRGDNSSAKAALSRGFSPQLSLHANALRAVLACQTHDRATGERYLSSQAKTYPNSPYLDRMRRACGVTSVK